MRAAGIPACVALLTAVFGSAVFALECGDADGNGLVTVSDGVQALRAAAGLGACTSTGCDVDGNGRVTVSDGVNVLRKAAGLLVLENCIVDEPSGPSSVDLTVTTGGGDCGQIAPGPLSDDRLLNPDDVHLTCGGLVLGGGVSTNRESALPGGTTTRLELSGCDEGVCRVTGMPDAGLPVGVEGSRKGSVFGTPVPIPNPAAPGLSVCVRQVFASAASGSLDLATGSMLLNLELTATTWITADADRPCPTCTGYAGTPDPADPKTGTCDRGASAGAACTTVNPSGLSKDCLPGGSDGSFEVPDFEIDLSPLVTGSTSKTDDAGIFCSGDAEEQQTTAGCFGGDSTRCTSITATGTPAGPLTVDVPSPVTLASVFCLPKAGHVLIDGATSLPGPGVLTVTGRLTVHP